MQHLPLTPTLVNTGTSLSLTLWLLVWHTQTTLVILSTRALVIHYIVTRAASRINTVTLHICTPIQWLTWRILRSGVLDHL